MSGKEEGSFQHNGTPCNVTIKDNTLVIEGVSDNSTPASTLLIPFSEILTVKAVGEEDVRTLNLKRKIKLPHLAVRTIKRYKDHRWRLINVKLKSKYHTLCQQWAKRILQKLSEFQVLRPKFLLIFVNPFGGNRSAKSIYNKKVKPIFDEAEIKTEVITTSFRHHAKSFIESNDMSQYDGIVAVGGDGMLNEVVNGLISQTQSKSGISVNAKKGDPRSCPEFLRPNLRVAVIPAGSTDCVSYVTQGINDAETSALHIALGDSHPVDVVSLHNADGVFQQFSMSLTGYGYFGDTLRHSENYRWMGPPRYTFVGANVFLRNKSYSGEVHYLPADDTEDPVHSSFCRTPCSICKGGFSDFDNKLFTPITPSTSFENRLLFDEGANGTWNGTNGVVMAEFDGTDEGFDAASDAVEKNNEKGRCEEDVVSTECKFVETEDCDKAGVIIPDVSPGAAVEEDTAEIVEEADENQTLKEVSNDSSTSNSDVLAEVSRSDDISNKSEIDGGIDRPPRPGTLTLNQDTDGYDQEEWKVISGEFMSVKGVLMSCACEKSPLGISPYSHLSDGAIDLIVVKSCSRFEFLRYMISLSGKADRFDFPFVEVRRVKAFQFIPSTPDIHQSFNAPSSPRSATSGSNTDTSCGDSVHISLDNLSVKYRKNSEKKTRQKRRGMKRSQSMVSGRVSTWNSDGEIVSDANMTVRVHRGLILMFCRGIEEISTR